MTASDEDIQWIDDEEKDPRNQLKVRDFFWIALHAATAVLDIRALVESLSVRHKGTILFGGHSQYLANWSMLLSIITHAAVLYSMLAIDPHLTKWTPPRVRKRERVYTWTAQLWSCLVCFSAVSMTCSTVWAALEDKKWPVRTNSFGSLWLNFGSTGFAWFTLIFQQPRHWMCGPTRFIVRRSLLFELSIGQSGVHALLTAYLTWLVVCRCSSGRWAYSSLDTMMPPSPTLSAAFLGNLVGLLITIHLVAWGSWRAALALAPPQKVNVD